MLPHPTTIHLVAALRRQELLSIAARERSAEVAVAPAPRWTQLALRVLALVALALGSRA